MSASVLRGGRFWAFVPVLLLTGVVGAQVFLLHRALSDPSMAVEDGYYGRALDWDERRAELAASAALGWQTDLALTRSGDVLLVLRDRSGAPVRGAEVEVRAFAVARSRDVRRATLRELDGGRYGGGIPVDRGGLWEIEVRARAGADRFATTLRRDVGGGP